MTTQKLFAASVILFIFSIFILVTTPSAEAASNPNGIKLYATNNAALDLLASQFLDRNINKY